MTPDPNKSSDAHKRFFNLPREDDGDNPQEREVLQLQNGNDAAENHRQTLENSGLPGLIDGLIEGLGYLKHEIYHHYSDVHLGRLTHVAQLDLMVSLNEGIECIENYLQLKLDRMNRIANYTPAVPAVQN